MDKAERSVRTVLKKFAELEREIEEAKALALKEAEEGDEDNDDNMSDDDIADD